MSKGGSGCLKFPTGEMESKITLGVKGIREYQLLVKFKLKKNSRGERSRTKREIVPRGNMLSWACARSHGITSFGGDDRGR